MQRRHGGSYTQPASHNHALLDDGSRADMQASFDSSQSRPSSSGRTYRKEGARDEPPEPNRLRHETKYGLVGNIAGQGPAGRVPVHPASRRSTVIINPNGLRRPLALPPSRSPDRGAWVPDLERLERAHLRSQSPSVSDWPPPFPPTPGLMSSMNSIALTEKGWRARNPRFSEDIVFFFFFLGTAARTWRPNMPQARGGPKTRKQAARSRGPGKGISSEKGTRSQAVREL